MSDTATHQMAEKDQYKKDKTKERRDEQSVQNDLLSVMNTIQGRRVLWKYGSAAGAISNCFSPDPYENARLSGNKEMGILLFKDIKEANYDLFLQMMKENDQEKGDE